MSSIVFINHAPRAAKNYVLIAQILQKLQPNILMVYLDLANFSNLPKEPAIDVFANMPVRVIKAIDMIPIGGKEDLISVFKQLISEIDPVCIVVPFDWWLYADLISCASNAGARSVVVQDSIMDDTVLFPKASKKVIPPSLKSGIFSFFRKNTSSPNIDHPTVCSRNDTMYCLTGEYYRRILSDRYPEHIKQFKVTGSLRMEATLGHPKMQIDVVKQVFKIPTDSDFILYISQPFDVWPEDYTLKSDYRQAILDTIIHAHRLQPELYHVVLVHPDEDVEDWVKIVESCRHLKCRIRVRKGFTASYLSLYQAASKLVGFSSTCLIEAMIIGRSILTLDYIFESPILSVLVEGNAVMPVTRREHLGWRVKCFLEEKFSNDLIRRQRLLLQDLFGMQDGHCSKRAAYQIAGNDYQGNLK